MGINVRNHMTDIEYQMLKIERERRELYRRLKYERKSRPPIGDKTSSPPQEEAKRKDEASKLKDFLELAKSLGF